MPEPFRQCGVLLSIVTITKCDPEGCRRTLNSTAILRAEACVEHVVVDGDGGAEAEAVSAGCRWIRQSGTGIAAAFNEGLAATRGEWVWFLNGGDRAHESLDSAWLLGLLQRTLAEVFVGAIHYDGDEFPRTAPPLSCQWPLHICWVQHPVTLVRRAALQRVGGFDQRYKICMDFDLWQRLLTADPVVDVVAIPFARFDTGGISRRPEHRSQLARENLRVLWRYRVVFVRSFSKIVLRYLSAVAHSFVRCWS